MPDCPRCDSNLEETAEHVFYNCERVRLSWGHVGEWTVRIEPKQLLLLDVGYVVDNVLLLFQGKKRVVFLVILAVARMIIWTTQFCSLAISLGSKSDAIENAWIA